jgi:cell division protein DivIC
MNLLKNVLPWLKNRYVLTLLVFGVWMTFFDSHDLITQYRYRVRLSELEENKRFYEEQIIQVKKDREELMTDTEKLEKFAREKYKMKKDDEDLYIVIRK